ncbi:hypothetical protein [Gilvimarinus sp. 1_MG-2023]|uniref:hypothetical protein n=1 Tax=Gilvimarinus sp. 1_MG-2023 TaxID=3062638 RepID=UPI0026E2B8A5|nr:hypothetical protein [Gilvimarinus sp. 1_MG-2023]MDO6747168.1 hypothetical protein [Gilvimarinus sp. 1_MG-2023]
MKNKIEDMRDHLFAELERLGDETLKGENLKLEIARAKAITEVSQAMINSAKVETDFIKTVKATKGTGFIDPSAREELPVPGKPQLVENQG